MKAKKNQPVPVSKKEFILSRPDLSAKDVVAEAARSGIKTTVAYVYVTRSEASLSARKSARKTAKSSAAPASDGAGGRDLEAEFAAVALYLGLQRAGELLVKLRLLGQKVSARI